MNLPAEFVRERRRRAWARGREIRDSLLKAYHQEYGLESSPPPAKIINELLTDFLKVSLVFDPLPCDIFAQTEWADGRPLVVVNSLTAKIAGVRDAEGVQNVAKWHEAIHIADHLDLIRPTEQCTLPGFEPTKIICYRSGTRALTGEALSREFWAEEAGRAAAVSLAALRRSEAFRELCNLASLDPGPVRRAWPLLYRAGADIGVNISALVKQLRLEGWIGLDGEAGRQMVYVQPALLGFVEAA